MLRPGAGKPKVTAEPSRTGPHAHVPDSGSLSHGTGGALHRRLHRDTGIPDSGSMTNGTGRRPPHPKARHRSWTHVRHPFAPGSRIGQRLREHIPGAALSDMFLCVRLNRALQNYRPMFARLSQPATMDTAQQPTTDEGSAKALFIENASRLFSQRCGEILGKWTTLLRETALPDGCLCEDARVKDSIRA